MVCCFGALFLVGLALFCGGGNLAAADLDLLRLRDVICFKETRGFKHPEWRLKLDLGYCQIKLASAVDLGYGRFRDPAELFTREGSKAAALELLVGAHTRLVRLGAHADRAAQLTVDLQHQVNLVLHQRTVIHLRPGRVERSGPAGGGRRDWRPAADAGAGGGR